MAMSHDYVERYDNSTTKTHCFLAARQQSITIQSFLHQPGKQC